MIQILEMSKKKQPAQPQLSPEKYIQTRARSLALDKCYINGDWKESGMASILVTRKHVTGNHTVGVYLVDLFCLGLKDSYYFFNIDDDRLEEIIGNHFTDEIDYNTVHNIIYGGIEYSGEIGFKPAKEWSVTEFILEPDDDNIPLVDIEFGKNGRPYFLFYESDETYKTYDIINILEKNVGAGNYEAVRMIEAEENDFDDEGDFDFDEDEDFEDEDFEDVINSGSNRDIEDEYIEFEEEKDK